MFRSPNKMEKALMNSSKQINNLKQVNTPTTKLSKRRFLAGIAIAGALSISSIAQAGPHCNKLGDGKHGYKHDSKHGSIQGKRHRFNHRKSPEFMQKRLDRMTKKLELSDIQKQHVQALIKNHRNTIKPLRNEKYSLRKEMRRLDPSASDYSAKLADIANRKAELVRQITIAQGNKRQQMAQILTDEQRAKRKAMRARHHGAKRI